MSKFVFPAVFQWDASEETYLVTFPDLENCFTDGKTVLEALENAGDVMNLMLWTMEQNEESIPLPSPFDKVALPQDGFVNLIVADTAAYQEVIDWENNPIKYARKKAGLNIKQLAELLHAPYRTVQDWNTAQRMPPKWVQSLIIEKIESVR